MASVRDDDVVGQVYVHGLGGFPHEFRQPLVVVAGVRVAGGMVVDKGYLCGALQQGFAQDAPQTALPSSLPVCLHTAESLR